jgi:hypothetical protein
VRAANESPWSPKKRGFKEWEAVGRVCFGRLLLLIKPRDGPVLAYWRLGKLHDSMG